ncbi:mannitol dehydrogenase family protein [Paracoccus sp. 1_MG-2023]|uniref:mannitol dehydrogenase family protein n=1 Tax=unclassified Paracoccus (in: a-proteobacteria) TaxID=2688777 RepID=UPI001C0862E7|nr:MULTISPECIES: mannitol dehydrogenase family protein [unclassified Paracoccus (in: a-proteobacteria)]MBU2958320.1 mannitol dehydrogenase family protein [Paracoccus sp. C2R09]MDO6668447.1 mannitol dehydrogenase family protein [Paracoccus sp. 1_MG-2023]
MNDPIRLCDANLSQINAAVPQYDRSELTGGILHFGLGNFHRAHQAVYLDQLMNTGEGHDFAIVGAGVMPTDARMREVLLAQDCLFTVVEQTADTAEARVIGAMTDHLPAADAQAIIAKLADPAIRIASLTITEGGYFIDANTGHFDVTHPAIVHDGNNPDVPRTVFGMLVAGLAARRRDGRQPFTVMCCDNIPHNGVVTREAVIETARLSDPELAEWIAANVAFPNGMVDRITPATSDRERAMIRSEFGIADETPVFAEDFIQWVLEDNFPAGRPALEKVGVQFVPDVTPYEMMKIRILNGGHAILAYAAGLLDIQYVHEAMQEPLVSDFLEKVETSEVIPVVPPVPETDLSAYFAKVKERCANPKIADTVRRLCLDGSNRQPKFIIPTIRDRLARDLPVDGLALECALWCRYCAGTTDGGAVIAPNDPSWDRLTRVAQEARHDPAQWLAMADIYGDTGTDPRLIEPFAKWLGMLWEQGAEATLRTYIEG